MYLILFGFGFHNLKVQSLTKGGNKRKGRGGKGMKYDQINLQRWKRHESWPNTLTEGDSK